MPIVGMPDGTQVQFPDDMPKEQIRDMIAKKFPDSVPKHNAGDQPSAQLESLFGKMPRQPDVDPSTYYGKFIQLMNQARGMAEPPKLQNAAPFLMGSSLGRGGMMPGSPQSLANAGQMAAQGAQGPTSPMGGRPPPMPQQITPNAAASMGGAPPMQQAGQQAQTQLLQHAARAAPHLLKHLI